jgi:predicted nucleic-acid-binding protein
MMILDTNAVLRFLLRDDEEKAVYVYNMMKQETCLIPIEVLAEAVYVLVKTYKIERTLIQEKLLDVLWRENVETPDQGVAESALRCFGETRFDFVDCLMIGYSLVEDHQIVMFDKKVKKYLSQSTLQP